MKNDVRISNEGNSMVLRSFKVLNLKKTILPLVQQISRVVDKFLSDFGALQQGH